ncbi:hypothetical protein ACRRRY_000161 [Salmonella enterica subsp. enterica]
MKPIKHSYEMELNKLKLADAIYLGLNQDDAQIWLEYKNRFPMFQDRTQVNVFLEPLWEALDKPYGRYREWINQVVIPVMERRFPSTEISVIRDSKKGKTKGGHGSTKKQEYVPMKIAQQLAMMVNGESGDIACRYFLLIEDLFINIIQNNATRISIHKSQDEVYKETLASTHWSKEAAQSETIRFNSLMKKIVGARNDKSTDIKRYDCLSPEIKRQMATKTDREIISFFCH